MYEVTYVLSTGIIVRRTDCAKAALEALDLLNAGGGWVLRKVVTRISRAITLTELQFCSRSGTDDPQALAW